MGVHTIGSRFEKSLLLIVPDTVCASQEIPLPEDPCQIKQGLCCHKCRTRADCKLCLEWKDRTHAHTHTHIFGFCHCHAQGAFALIASWELLGMFASHRPASCCVVSQFSRQISICVFDWRKLRGRSRLTLTGRQGGFAFRPKLWYHGACR